METGFCRCPHQAMASAATVPFPSLVLPRHSSFVLRDSGVAAAGNGSLRSPLALTTSFVPQAAARRGNSRRWKPPTCKIFGSQYAFNFCSHNSPVMAKGHNEEEMKLVKETRKIWDDQGVQVTATCIRVPITRAHAEATNLQFEHPIDEETARQILHDAQGVTVVDDRHSNTFRTPLEVSFKDEVAVGRITHDISQNGSHGLDLFGCGDQICKDGHRNASASLRDGMALPRCERILAVALFAVCCFDFSISPAVAEQLSSSSSSSSNYISSSSSSSKGARELQREVSCKIRCFRADPVCGKNGVTYWCGAPEAKCNGVEVAHTSYCGDPEAKGTQSLFLVNPVWLAVAGFLVTAGFLWSNVY